MEGWNDFIPRRESLSMRGDFMGGGSAGINEN
jgi:hypothetical protein